MYIISNIIFLKLNKSNYQFKILIMYLSKEKCSIAIEQWNQTRPNYSKIKDLISPTDAFHFTKEDCKWLNTHEDKSSNRKFRMYTGVYNSELILIVYPLDLHGKQKILDSYLAKAVAPLENDISLVETQTIVITEKTILSKNLEVLNLNTCNQSTTLNEPKMPEKLSVVDIERWKNSCLDWFYHECTDYKGERIFKSFIVPFSDLVRTDEGYHSVICFFAFKMSEIYQRLVPVLIFVSINEDTQEAKIVTNEDPDTKSNVYDWSQPCPPFCKDFI